MWDAERGAPHGEVARQSHVRGVRYRLGPRESLARCWIGGGRMHLLDEITHPTRAIGEVAAPVAVVAQPFGYGGEPGQRASWVGLWLMRQSSTAAGSSAVTSPCNSADRRSTRVGFEAAVPADVSDAPTIPVLDPIGVADHHAAVVVQGEPGTVGLLRCCAGVAEVDALVVGVEPDG
jgi:hypothetical protein